MTNLKLNLGCGSDYRPGYINVDRVTSKVDVLHNLGDFPYPFEDNVASEILLFHALEHMREIKPVMDELWRILAPHGRLTIRVPHFTHFQALTHPEHYHAFHYNSLNMFTAGAREPYTDKLWQIWKSELHFDGLGQRLFENIFNNHKFIYTTTILAYLFPAHEIEFWLQPAKE